MTALRKLFSFNGGVKPAPHKAASTAEPIAIAPLPERLMVPLWQSTGAAALPLVQAGDRVLKGQRIGAADGGLSVAVHAPSSGTVLEIGPQPMAHPSGLLAPAIVLATDGEERWTELEPVNVGGTPPDALRDILRDAGIVGLGGAVFPSHQKLRPGAHGTRTLIINGAECEPFITCDDMLMRERAAGVLRGAMLMKHILQAREILIGIEDNKPEALAAMRAAAGSEAEVVAVPTRYPAGGAKQLIRVLTGIEVPHGRRSTDYGVQCFNVGTAFAIHQALDHGQPLISRLVTVAGNVARPRNYEVLIGTAMREVVALAGPRPDTNRYIMGGPMMGLPMPGFDVPVVKATNAILAGSPTLFPPAPPEQPCIRCGDCARACPADLQPLELYWFSRARNFGKAQEYHLFDCIECGCCAYVCPAHIPLVDYYRYAKSEVWAREREKEAADAARQRFEFRNFRQEREDSEKAAKLAARNAAAAAAARAAADSPAPSATAAEPAEPAAEDQKKALIAAALARAQAQQAAAPPRNTDNLSAETQAEIAAIEARRQEPATTANIAGGDATGTSATPTAIPAAADKKKALIAAALARAQAQQAAAPPRNTDKLSAETQAEIAAIEARRQQAARLPPEPAPEPPREPPLEPTK